MELIRLRRTSTRRNFLAILFFTVLGFVAMGYHPGAEDDGIYLASVKADLNPALFPHDAQFFQMQMRTSVFDTWMAHFVHATGISVAWSEFLWQFVSLFLIIWACHAILSQLFDEASARWGGIAMLAAMFTLPVAGTALYIADQYLHPRNPATALILFGVSRILAGKRWQAVPLLLVAFILHPLMGALGVSFCCILALTLFEPVHAQIRAWRARGVPITRDAVTTPVAALIPFGWVFSPPSQSFLDAIRSRHCFDLFQWTWYEWLGAVCPLILFWLVARIARKRGNVRLSRFATAVLIYSIFQLAIAMIILMPQAPISLRALEPMRFLQLVYVFLALIGGAYLAKYILRGRVWRWALFLLVANGGMFVAQRQLFAGTEHIEFPGRASANPWLQTFDWISHNTPENAYFAIDPYYMAAAEEDNHGFRARAERSVLADAIKDPAAITKAPELGPPWAQQVNAQAGWSQFQLADFERLKSQFGVDWVVVSYPPRAALDCRWHNQLLSVCRIP